MMDDVRLVFVAVSKRFHKYNLKVLVLNWLITSYPVIAPVLLISYLCASCSVVIVIQ